MKGPNNISYLNSIRCKEIVHPLPYENLKKIRFHRKLDTKSSYFEDVSPILLSTPLDRY